MKVTRYMDGHRMRWWEGWPSDGLDHHVVSIYEPRPWQTLVDKVRAAVRRDP